MVSQILLEVVSKALFEYHCQRLCLSGSNRVSNEHLESEGTGKDGGQVYRVSADQAPVNRKK
jgi:hypothetical protein